MRRGRPGLLRRARDRQRGLRPRGRGLGRAGRRGVAIATKGSLQSCNSAKAQGGIQAAFGEDDSPEQHAADVWQSSHETADLRLVEVLTGEAHARDPLARGARRRVHARERRLPPRALRRRERKRLLQVGDRTGHAITKALRDAFSLERRRCFPERRRSSELEPTEHGWRATRRRARDRRGDRRARRRRPLLSRGGGARRAVDEPSRTRPAR